jgi:hypothetical protein
MRVLLVVFLSLSACACGSRQPSGSSVTITLPPPKQVAAPGFGSELEDGIPSQR